MLNFDPLLERTDVIADVEVRRRLHSGKKKVWHIEWRLSRHCYLINQW